MTRTIRPWGASLLALSALTGCEQAEVVVDRYRDLTPHEAYVESLREAGLAGTALGREWIEASRTALRQPTEVDIPFQEAVFLAPDDPDAAGYRFAVERGTALALDVTSGTEDPSARVFVELFRVPADSTDPMRPVEPDTVGGTLHYEPWRAGEFILRVQPELLRGGRVEVTVRVNPALAFPVEGEDSGAAQSLFGAPRDGGRRRHHGVDIFSRRGTPVLAVTDGYVSRANVTNLGGKVVWLRDRRRSQSVYYAHLDSQAVSRGQRVSRGDTVGFVGNTGNARTTPPHLHFGIYRRGEGPIDPMPFIRERRSDPPALTADLDALGRWVRLSDDGIRLRSAPSSRGKVMDEMTRLTPVRVLAGSGDWYRVQLPDGRSGYVAARLTEPVERPVRSQVASRPGALQARPDPRAPVVSPVDAGTELPVLGEFDGYLFVQSPEGRRGWMQADG